MGRIIMTLGRTQPPHKAHINMLAEAFLGLKPGDTLLHMIGSTNVDEVSTGNNILSFEERKEIFIIELLEELNRRGYTLTQEALLQRFECKSLPDYSDNTAVFPTKEMQQARSKALNQAKLFLESNDAKVQSHTAPIYAHKLNYIAWGFNTLNILQTSIESMPKSADSSRPKIVYEVCNKDRTIQEHIDLLCFLVQKHKDQFGFDFEVKLTEVLKNQNMVINSTQIRKELLTRAQEGMTLVDVKKEIDNNPSLALGNLGETSLRISYAKMCWLVKAAR